MNRCLYDIFHERYLQLRYSEVISNIPKHEYIWKKLATYHAHGKFARKVAILSTYQMIPIQIVTEEHLQVRGRIQNSNFTIWWNLTGCRWPNLTHLEIWEYPIDPQDDDMSADSLRIFLEFSRHHPRVEHLSLELQNDVLPAKFDGFQNLKSIKYASHTNIMRLCEPLSNGENKLDNSQKFPHINMI